MVEVERSIIEGQCLCQGQGQANERTRMYRVYLYSSSVNCETEKIFNEKLLIII